MVRTQDTTQAGHCTVLILARTRTACCHQPNIFLLQVIVLLSDGIDF